MFIIEEITILIVNTDKSYIKKIEEVLSKISKNIIVCTDFDKAVGKLLNDRFDFLITDINMFDESFTIRNFIDAYPQTDLIIAATNSSYGDGSKALNQGVRDYINIQNEIITLPIKLLNYFEDKKDKTKDFKKDAEAKYLKWVLEQTGGNVTAAARRLELSARQMFNKIKEYDIVR